MAQVELRLASCYTESKAAALNDVLEEFFFDDGTLWEAGPLPTGVRDVTYEILATMVSENTFLVCNQQCSSQASSKISDRHLR